MEDKEFTHIDHEGKPKMVDVSDKNVTRRVATAESLVYLPEEVRSRIVNGELHTSKGAVFQTAIIAGVMAAKKTSELIPFCHPLPVEGCDITCALENEEVRITCTVKTTSRTGVEMEALTGASVAALTIYDMCKALSHSMELRSTRLLSKTGGKNDFKL
jgi:cyclic pyranopterin phosphate synthase